MSARAEEGGCPRDRTAQRIRLTDGRWLGYAEYGDPGGRPLLAFHGTPGSRLMVQAADERARRVGVRLVAPDRPGFGLSTRLQERRFTDWPRDVVELADALGIGRFGVIGVSGGGPYAIACAWRIPARLTVAGIVSGVGPINDVGAIPLLDTRHRAAIELARRTSWLGRPLMAFGAVAWRHFPQRMFQQVRRLVPPADAAVLARPEVAAAMMAGVSEAFRQGSLGAAEELRLFTQPWGFPLDDITVPVQLWHGADDNLVPSAAARHLAELIPGCRLSMVSDGGHYLVYDLIDQLLELAAH